MRYIVLDGKYAANIEYIKYISRDITSRYTYICFNDRDLAEWDVDESFNWVLGELLHGTKHVYVTSFKEYK